MVKRAGIKANSKAFTTKMAMAENTLRKGLLVPSLEFCFSQYGMGRG